MIATTIFVIFVSSSSWRGKGDKKLWLFSCLCIGSTIPMANIGRSFSHHRSNRCAMCIYIAIIVEDSQETQAGRYRRGCNSIGRLSMLVHGQRRQRESWTGSVEARAAKRKRRRRVDRFVYFNAIKYRCVQLKQRRVTRSRITRLECRYRFRERRKSKRIDPIRFVDVDTDR